MTNRALILAALADGPGRLDGPLVARDTELMAAGLRALGVGIHDSGTGSWRVTPAPLYGPASVDVGNAGTVMRFLPAAAALARGPVRFTGDPRAAERPIGPLVEALRVLGVEVSGDRMPLSVFGTGAVPGGEARLDASRSSQFVSALLLAGARYDKGVTVVHDGPPVPSLPHIAMTVQMLRQAGVVTDDDETGRWSVEPGVLTGRCWTVEPDLSNAAPFLAAALVTGGQVRVPRWPTETTQAGAVLPELLTRMGAQTEWTEDGLVLRGTGAVHGLDADLHDVGELTPVLAAVCALASTPSHLTGIAHLRSHETDRLAALATELNALGGRVTETEDGLRIVPANLHGGPVATYDDHRLATAAAVLGLAVPGIMVRDIETTAKTMPDFPDLWTTMVAS
ncbi:MAG: 3-phosphoshikimate 1-carboxyvinyltransferase [Geodermatophilaceae bacterium]|nr:3-phosphoshikimate 1-carboxyvinyltransferase [Geodermatophilaceae bacterium]